MKIQPIVIGTAGHIDHGKSTLVRALTGIDPDRLKEEKERGMTIDLGFAPLELSGGRRVGIVDVPGHEKFIRNMVAGASGIDLVVLVVAADDGVMPQTREHLAIMEVLGVRRGMIALTKVDIVESEMVELAAEDVREAVEGTFLEDAPLVEISALTGQGLDRLREVLEELVLGLEPRTDAGVFRMPVQRVFSKRGFGTVVTGIPVSGSVGIGDVLEVLPGGHRGRVRGLHAYGEKTERGRAGHSTAINFSDLDQQNVARGAVVAQAGIFQPMRMLGVRFSALSELPFPVTNRLAVRLHTGTADVLGELVLLDEEELRPGESCLAQVRLREPVVCAPGDLFLLRLPSPAITLGGGTVLEESRHRLKRFKKFVIEELEQQEEGLETVGDFLEILLKRAHGLIATSDLGVAAKLDKKELARELQELTAAGRVCSVGRELWAHPEFWEKAGQTLLATLTDWFDENPHRERVDVRDMRSTADLDGPLFDALLEDAAERGLVERLAGGRLTLPGRHAAVDPKTRALAEQIEARLTEARFQPPAPEDLARDVGASVPALSPVLEWMLDAGRVERVRGDFLLSSECAKEARAAVIENCERNGKLVIPELRDRLGTSRKFLIPLLEYFDAQGLTLRQAGHRILKRR